MAHGSRQYHTKSRNGCGQCKKRRVRVGEVSDIVEHLELNLLLVQPGASCLLELPEAPRSMRLLTGIRQSQHGHHGLCIMESSVPI